MRFDSTTDCAGVAIILYKVVHPRPGIILADQLDGLVLAVIVREGMVVLVPEYSESKVIMVSLSLRRSMPSSDRDHFSAVSTGWNLIRTCWNHLEPTGSDRYLWGTAKYCTPSPYHLEFVQCCHLASESNRP